MRRAGAKTVGYVVVRGNGAIGPGGVHDPSLSAGLMSAAIAKAHENGMKTVSAWVPGLNGGALMAAFGPDSRSRSSRHGWPRRTSSGSSPTCLPSGFFSRPLLPASKRTFPRLLVPCQGEPVHHV